MHPDGRLSHVLRLDEGSLVSPETPALIGVSGGRDSVALLHALVQRGVRALTVCHFDHRWRAESAREGEWVAELAESFGLPVELGASAQTGEPPGEAGGKRSVASTISPVDVAAAKSARQSPETAARVARYRFFAEVAARRGCSHLYLAHHADDQVETFFFNLLRGAGSAGLCGMHAVSEQVIGGTPLAIHRPLLGTWREEIDRYSAAHGLSYCEDPSNAETHHTRNRVRHEILPALEKMLGRQVREPLWRAAEIASAENTWLAAQAPVFAPGGEVPVTTVLALPLALQRRSLHAWLQASGVPQVGFEDVEDVLRLCTQRYPAKVNLSANWHARRRARVLFLTPGAARAHGPEQLGSQHHQP